MRGKLCVLLALLTAVILSVSFMAPYALADNDDSGLLSSLRFSEVMSSNKSTLALPDGSFPDWIELENLSDETIELQGCVLRCGSDSWTFPDVRLDPGAFRLVFCDKTGSAAPDDELHADFAVSREGERLALISPDGVTIDTLDLPSLSADVSWARGFGEDFGACEYPSPGFENSEDGYAALQNTRSVTSGCLAIGEVMVYNEWYLPQESGDVFRYYDWVEITNYSDHPVSTENCFLSDRDSDLRLYALPTCELQPGDSLTILCSPDGGQAPFALDSASETLYLTQGDGKLCDYVCLRNIPLGCSFGREADRSGFFYYSVPSPGEQNTDGARFIGTMPYALAHDGVFDNVESVRVDLVGPGLIRYTLDGSVPTEESALYVGPIVLNTTAVVRAVCYQEDHLPSAVKTLSYIINEGHSLPVVSLVCEPEDLFGSRTGIYTHPSERWERQGSVMFYAGDERFALDCGVRLHGATSRTQQNKKSFKLCFRDRYEGRLFHDLFGNGVAEFKSILLRSAQEGNFSTQIRDVLMHSLSLDLFPELPAQDTRFAVLYINGKYWGVYGIREAHSDTHFAQHFGFHEDSVSQWKQQWPIGSEPDNVYRFAVENDMSDPENYSQVSERLDIDTLIGWCVIESYSGNLDTHSPNMRFYYSEEDGILRYALVDLDLSLLGTLSIQEQLNYSYAYTQLLTSLLKNAEFREQMLLRFSAALNGMLREESVIERIDCFAEELRPEMTRDYERWSLPPEQWETMIEQMKNYLHSEGGRSYLVAESLRRSGYFTETELERFLG